MLDQLHALLTTYVARQPAWASAPRITTLTSFTSGYATAVYAWTLEYGIGTARQHDALVLKTYAATPEGAALAVREWTALTQLRAVGYPVPRAHLLETDRRHIGCPFLIMEQIQGHPLWHVFEHATAERRAELTELFVRLLVDLQAVDPERLLPGGTPTDPYAVIDRELAELRALDAHLAGQPSAAVIQWLAEKRDSVPCAAPVISHRDFHPWNVLLTSAGQPYVIDWEWQLGDPRFDLAWTMTLMQRSGFVAFATAVQQAYERMTGAAVTQLAYFEVLTSTRWLLNVMRALRFDAHLQGPAHAAARAFLTAQLQQAAALIHAHTALNVPVEGS